MPIAELRPVDGETEEPTFEVWTEPWGADPFTEPSDRDWDAFSASEDCASFHFRGGPDILRELAAGVAEGRIPPARALADERVGWWIRLQLESYPESFAEDEEGDELPVEDACRRLLEAIRDGSLAIDAPDGPHAYYHLEWTNAVADAARALELPAWAWREDYEGGGPGSAYQGWLICLEPGYTLVDLEAWLDDPERPRGGA